MTVKIPTRKERSFLPEDFKVTDWEKLKPYYEILLEQTNATANELKSWFEDRSELESMLDEDLAWRYIKMTCDTEDQEAADSYQFFIRKIQPNVAPYTDKLNKKVLASPFIEELDDPAFQIFIREIRKDIKIFREENIPLITEIQSQAQKFGKISGAMTIDDNGKELTLQQAAVILQSTDRSAREKIYYKIGGRRLQDKEELNELYTNLIELRHKVAVNADFENFRDYMFEAMGRFDYTVEDCFAFHDSVETEVVPLMERLTKERKERMGLDQLRPWDKAVDIDGKEPLVPFHNGQDLLKTSVSVFSELQPYLGERLSIMGEMGHLDLESRKGKAPGGYNYPLAEIGVPFIFMNATSTLRDMVTLMHEGGHAVHSFLTRDLAINAFKNAPSEVAELASMSMELLSMEHWDLFFSDQDELRRAKHQHLSQIIETLPWVATIDKFQHWVYLNPLHTEKNRKKEWNKVFGTFTDSITDWEKLEMNRNYLWQKQLHLFEVPFYYIEYGMAQLGAIAIWKNFKQDKDKGLDEYLNALRLGYTRTIPEIYQAAGIQFDFSQPYIKKLMEFVNDELDQLQ